MLQTKLGKINSRLQTASLQDEENSEILPHSSSPLEEDFLEVTYRALSAALLADRAVDFSNEPMLKRATKLLDGQTVFKDHQTSVDNWIGRVGETYWDTETKGIPPGINARLKLDTIKDPMVARGVIQGALHSASVTVSFEWKPSHPKLMDEGTFFQKMGEEVDDELVRVVVTKIEKFWEISLVWQGADQFAKQIGEDGKPVHQDADPDAVSLSTLNPVIDNKEEDMKLLEILKKALGADVSEENLEKLLQEQTTASYKQGQEESSAKHSNELEALKLDLEKSCVKIQELQSKIIELEPNAALGVKYLSDERIEAIRLCKLAKGEKVSEAILKTLEKGELEVVQAWTEEFKKEVEEKYPARCQSCESTNISRQSAKVSENEEQKDSGLRVVGVDTANRLQNLHN